MHRAVARRFGVRTTRLASERTERHRCVRWTKRRRADLGKRHAELLAHQREPDHVARLPLGGTHAERGVALQVPDRLVTLALRARAIGARPVVMQIADASRAVPRRARPERIAAP